MNAQKSLQQERSRTFWKQAAALAIWLSLGLGNSLWGQTVASISGTITDASGAVLSGASVTVKNLETGSLRIIAADDAGRYDAESLAVGQYEVRAEAPGFRPEIKTGITLVVGQHAEVNLTLRVGQVQEAVIVQETGPVVSVSTQDISGLVGERQVKDLPLNGRSYDQLLTLNPGIVNYTSQRAGGIGTSNSVVGSMFSSSGHRPQENLYLLNGVEFTSASEINNTPGGVSGQLLGVDAVREFAVVKDTYGAEYGKRPGAQVNIVTASGTNQLHGNVYEFVRNDALDARNFFDQGSIPDFQRNVFGGSLGGPLRKDKTFLFGNYEGFRQNLGLSDLTLVPDAASRASAVASVRPLLALWPVANGPELLTSTGAPSGIAEAFSNPLQNIREDFGTARLDQIFSDKDSFSGVYTVDDSEAHSPTSNPFTLIDIFLREQVASLSETHIFSPSLLNRATFGFSRGGFYFNSGTTVDLPGWIHAGPAGGRGRGGRRHHAQRCVANHQRRHKRRKQSHRGAQSVYRSDQVTLTHGKHLFSFGAWVQRLQSNDSTCPRPVRADFVHQLAVFSARQGEHVHIRPDGHAAGLALAGRRLLCGRRDRADTLVGTAARLSRRVYQRLERGARTRVELRV